MSSPNVEPYLGREEHERTPRADRPALPVLAPLRRSRRASRAEASRCPSAVPLPPSTRTTTGHNAARHVYIPSANTWRFHTLRCKLSAMTANSPNDQALDGSQAEPPATPVSPTDNRKTRGRGLWRQLEAPRLYLASKTLFFVGLVIFLFFTSINEMKALLDTGNGPLRVILATSFMCIGLVGYVVFSPATPASTSFTQVDLDHSRARLTPERDFQAISSLIARLERRVEANSAAKNPVEIAEALRRANSFDVYFSGIQVALEQKADNADRKASVALEDGKRYLMMGIQFYLVSIVTWQVLTRVYGFQPIFAYGIGSCSLLFVFVEFLGAWFFKQYRTFVDTSTYLLKVKAIFDRYMLTFLLLRDRSIAAEANSLPLNTLLAMLKDDIRWPDTYLLKNADVAFARDALESFSDVIKGLRQQADGTKRDPSASR
ncbi:hypothetical protein [Polyangium spumosum]|uniref:Uncharacterized protein n=1 Tax=Polyangium spumosum TaxID=889282 RepID=A0A6N7Q2J0_9BACT|nr:hypothetical protein [Polyangium spumosum]MRG98558.1 hypothetical protein [Polyangium spumosum]